MTLNLKSATATAMAVAVAMVIVMTGVPAHGAQGAAGAESEPNTGQALAEKVWNALQASVNPEAAFATLSDVEREALQNYLMPASFEEEVTLVPLDPAAKSAVESGEVQVTYDSMDGAQGAVATVNACFGGYVRETAHAPAGNAIWDVYTEGRWCGSSSGVTSASWSRSWSTIAAIGWRDGGLLGKGSGVSGGQARIWSQRKMILGIGGWDAQTMHPCVRLKGSGTGAKSSDKVCSVY